MQAWKRHRLSVGWVTDDGALLVLRHVLRLGSEENIIDQPIVVGPLCCGLKRIQPGRPIFISQGRHGKTKDKNESTPRYTR